MFVCYYFLNDRKLEILQLRAGCKDHLRFLPKLNTQLFSYVNRIQWVHNFLLASIKFCDSWFCSCRNVILRKKQMLGKLLCILWIIASEVSTWTEVLWLESHWEKGLFCTDADRLSNVLIIRWLKNCCSAV